MIYLVQLPQISSKEVHEHVADGLYPEQLHCVSSCFISSYFVRSLCVALFDKFNPSTDTNRLTVCIIPSAIKLELTSKSSRRLCSMPLCALIEAYLADRDTRPWDMAPKTPLTLQFLLCTFVHLYICTFVHDLAYSFHVQHGSCLLCQ